MAVLVIGRWCLVGVSEVDIVLRPSRELAVLHSWAKRIWGEEIVFRNVPVRRATGPQS